MGAASHKTDGRKRSGGPSDEQESVENVSSEMRTYRAYREQQISFEYRKGGI